MLMFSFVACDFNESDDDANDGSEKLLNYTSNIVVKSGAFEGVYTNDVKNSVSAPIFGHLPNTDEYLVTLAFTDNSNDEIDNLLMISVKLNKMEPQTIVFNNDNENVTISFSPFVDVDNSKINTMTAKSGTIKIERISVKKRYTIGTSEQGFVDIKLSFSGLFDTLKYVGEEDGEPSYIEEEGIEVTGVIETMYIK